MEASALPPAASLLLAGLTGLIVGSFLNVVIYRLPLMLERGWRKDCRQFLDLAPVPDELPAVSLAWPNSFCPSCRAPVRLRENIPVLSFLMLRGRCRACRASIPLRYPAVELLTGVLSLLVILDLGWSWPGAAGLVFTWILLSLAAIDLEHQLLPDAITQPGLWLGLAGSLFGWFTQPGDAILGAIAGYGALWSVYRLYRLATGKEGMGFGDFKLLAMIGAWLGWQAIPAVILIASTSGALLGILLIVARRHDPSRPLPFGPYLAIAGFAQLVWGEQLLDAYRAWLGFPI